MPDNIARLIEVEDDRVEGIKFMFQRWETNEQVVRIVEEQVGLQKENVPEVGLGIPNAVTKSPIVVEKGSIHIQGSNSSMNERNSIFANILGQTIQIGFTDSQSYEKGGKTGTFIGQKGTSLEGVKHNFFAKDVGTLDIKFRKWMLYKLSKIYPNDYESKQKEDELYESCTEKGISYKYQSLAGKNSFHFQFEYNGNIFSGIPIVESKNDKYSVHLDARNKKGIAGYQFGNLVIGKDATLLTAVGKMIDAFVDVLDGKHSGIKKNWKTEEFQAIAKSFISIDS